MRPPHLAAWKTYGFPRMFFLLKGTRSKRGIIIWRSRTSNTRIMTHLHCRIQFSGNRLGLGFLSYTEIGSRDLSLSLLKWVKWFPQYNVAIKFRIRIRVCTRVRLHQCKWTIDGLHFQWELWICHCVYMIWGVWSCKVLNNWMKLRSVILRSAWLFMCTCKMCFFPLFMIGGICLKCHIMNYFFKQRQ